MLEVQGVHKSYGEVVALAGVDLSVAAGTICGLLGPNGAGKTSLVSIIAGLRRPDRGTVTVEGTVGLAPQDLGIYPTISVRENLVFFGELNGLRRRALASRIDDLAGALGLTHLLMRKASLLSGGEKRRLHTAMALLHYPSIMLLDEPTAGADVQTRAHLLDLVRKLAADGAAVCYSTHYLQEIEALDASVVILDHGRVIASGQVRELIAAHARPTIEMVFDDGRVVHKEAAEPASALAALGSDAARLQSLEIVKPSLESVYLRVTGRRYEEQGAPS